MAEEERLHAYLDTDTIIDITKGQLGITNSRSEMTDEDIRSVMKFLASGAPDTMLFDDKPIFGRIGFGLMLSLTLYEFPEFYERYGLSQWN